MPFPRALLQSEIQTFSSRIWTHFADLIFYYRVWHVITISSQLCNELSWIWNWTPEEGELFMVHWSVLSCARWQVYSLGCDWLLVCEWRYFSKIPATIEYCCRNCIGLRPVLFLSARWTLVGIPSPVSVTFIILYLLAYWVECLPMVLETSVQSQVESYQRLKKWFLMPPCLALSTIRWGSRVKWSNPGNGVAPSPTPLCGSYWKGNLRVTLD